MSDQEKKEQEIMNQEMSKDEMETVAGGLPPFMHGTCGEPSGKLMDEHCYSSHMDTKCYGELHVENGRPFRNPDGSVNCAATVEDGSWCGTNDACYDKQVAYMGIHNCAKAWD